MVTMVTFHTEQDGNGFIAVMTYPSGEQKVRGPYPTESEANEACLEGLRLLEEYVKENGASVQQLHYEIDANKKHDA
jgi:hypothetical protein